MECFTFLFVGAIMLVGIAWLVDIIKSDHEEKQMKAAWNRGDHDEYLRLAILRNQRRQIPGRARGNNPSDWDFLAALIILDAAEHGVFLPDGHQVFERLEGGDEGDEYLSFDDFADYEAYYDGVDDSEFSDHWGLG